MSEAASAERPAWAADVLRPLAEARNLPGFLYWRDDVFAAEHRRLFGTMWVCVGRREDLAESGSFATVELGPESLILTCDQDGRRHAFHNTCRHRGTRLVEEGSGQGMKVLVCPYHAWCYGLDGRLEAAPEMGEDLSWEEHALGAVRLDEWQGFLFACLGAAAPPLAAALADFPDVSGWEMDRLVRGASRTYEVEANWKVVCENYSECYHCPTVHPRLHRLTHLGASRDPVAGVCFNGGPMDLRDGCDTMSMSGRSPRPALRSVPPADRRLVHYYVLYPNLLLSLHPDYVMSHLLLPLEPGRTRVVCEWHFAPEVAAAADFDPADVVELWDLTNREDWRLCEGVQRGARSSGHRPGPYQGTEDCVHFFDRWYVQRMGYA